MQYKTTGFSKKRLLELYEAILTPRMIEEKMLILLRQGKISKWFSGWGQEGVSVGAAMALDQEAYILTMHRNLGVFTARNIPLERLFAQFQGKVSGFTNGRDRSFHFGTNEHKIVGMISHLGAQLGVADGIALANKLRGTGIPTMVFTGDGGASEGDFHEALNVAAVWELPVIFVLENNGYGLSTPSREQFKCRYFIDKAPGYGIESLQCDGNNLLDMHRTIEKAAKMVSKGQGPVLVEALTFRMRGHEEASGTKYVPKELMETWAKKDPVTNFEAFLLDEKIIDKAYQEKIRKSIAQRIESGLQIAFAEGAPPVNLEKEMRDLFAPAEVNVISPKSSKTKTVRFVDAISEGLRQSLEKHDNLLFMGQDIAEYGGVFKISEGFLEQFGRERIRNTPLCESAIIGAGLGLSIAGYKSVIEMQFADFVTCGFNQIVNNLAKAHYRWGQHADVVIRMPTGAGVGAGPFHSQSNEAWFFHVPGLKIVYPSNPHDAKGLLAAAIEDPNPFLYFEHKALYRSLSGEVPEDYYTIEVGKAQTVQRGKTLTIITYGMGVHWAVEAAKNHPEDTLEILDLRTLLPWDQEAVATAVRKTGKVLVLHEDTITGGIGAEIAAWIMEYCFEALDAPVMRVGSLDTPVPFATNLEENFLPKKSLNEKIESLLNY